MEDNDISYVYYSGYRESTNINFYPAKEKAELVHPQYSTMAYHPSHLWKIDFDEDSKISVKFKRAPNSYETVYMRVREDGIWKEYNPNTLSNCEGDKKEFKFDKVSKMRVMAKVINEKSDYKISISVVDDEFILTFWMALVGMIVL